MKCKKQMKAAGWMACVVATVFALQSCLDDNSYGTEDLLFSIGTVRVIEGQDYYMELDDGSNLYPTDTTAIDNYAVKDKQRAFVYFSLLEDELPGYDYNAKLEHIENILTKDIYRMPPDKADSIGNDRIDVDNIWLTQNHVNIVYKFYHSNDMNKKHMLNLVIDERQDVADDGYLHLAFRHNAYNDTPLQGGTGIVSFKLDNVRDQLSSYKGLCIEVNPLYGGMKTFIVDTSAD